MLLNKVKASREDEHAGSADDVEIDDLFDNDEQPSESQSFGIPSTALGREFTKSLIYANLVSTSAKRNSQSSGNSLTAGSMSNEQLLSAIFSCYALLNQLARKFNRTAETIVFPESIYQARSLYDQVIPFRTFEENGTKHWYGEAIKRKEDVLTAWDIFTEKYTSDFGRLYPGKKPSDEEFVEALYQVFLNSCEVRSAELFDEFFQLNSSLSNSAVHAHCQRIEHALHQRVKGQPQAIRAISASEMKSFRSSSKKLRDIFTFAGPSGVGKTELAKAYAETLRGHSNLGFEFRIFNMERYSDERSAGALFGAGSQFTDSSFGELTRHAVAYPRTVYLFDEIEKAHHTVIQSLLTLLDSGEAIDSTTQERASFSQSIVIFTTNLGQREFQRSQGMGELNIFDVLESAKLHNSDKTALTPELVNRLRAGTAVRFFPLHAEALKSIAEMHERHYREHTSGAFKFEFGPNMAALALFAGMPNPVPRAIANVFDSIISRAQKQLYNELADQPKQLDKIETIVIDADPNLFSAVDEKPLLTYVGENQASADALQAELQAKQFATIPPTQALKDIVHLASFAVICVDGGCFSQDDLALLIRRLRDISTQIGIILVNPSIEQLRDEYIIDHTWLQLASDAFSQQASELAKLGKIAQSLQLAAQKHLAFQYDIELVELAETTAIFVANDAKLTPQVSAQRANEGVQGLMTRRPSTRLTDVIGLHRAKQELQRVIGWLEDPSQLKRYNLPMPTGVLLLGPPGTGKTLLARAVAGEVDLPFISLNIGEMLSSFTNGTATNLQKAFDAARDIAPCVLFIDEIDALAGKRTNQDQNGGRSHNAAVNTLLTLLDGLQKEAEPIFVIAATNRADSLDPAITRSGRLDHPILCDIPNSEDRRQFIRFYMNKYNLSFTDKEITELATLTSGMSGADMEQIFVTTLYNAVSGLSSTNDDSHHPVNADRVREAITYIRYGAPTNIKLTKEAKLQTATHEAGHLLVQKLLLPHEHVTIATIEPRNRALGFISTTSDENRQPQTVAEVKARLAVLMAGREAEQLLYGSAGMNGGASSDLQQATRLALYAICTLGLDDEFGFISYGDNFLQLASPEERKLAAERVRAWLEEARCRARDLLKEQQDRLKFISEELCERESVYQPEIEGWFA